MLEGGILAGKAAMAREIGRDPGSIGAQIMAAAEPRAALTQGWGCSPATVAMAFALLDRIGAPTLRRSVAPLWCDGGMVHPEGP